MQIKVCRECGESFYAETLTHGLCSDCIDAIDNRHGESDDPPLCATCNGSGEGQFDGIICHNCKGKGLEP